MSAEPTHDRAPRLTVAAVAHRLGVAPATLRTWDRRYGLGPSEHAAGAHRRYSPADVTRLQTMRRLTLEGVPPGEAARVALGKPFVPAVGSGQTALRPAGGAAFLELVRQTDATAVEVAAAEVAAFDALVADANVAPLPDRNGRLAPRRGGPGGRVLALPGADATVRGLSRAAMALDAPAVTRIVRSQIASHGVLHTWDHVLRPVLVAVGARWAATGEGVEVEHMLSDCAAVALRATGDSVSERPDRRPVLLACAPDEQHALPLHALGASLAERGIATRTLGPAMPAAAIEAAVRRTGPAALFLWSQLRGTADVRVLETLPVTRPATAVVVGGPGWVPERLPDRVGLAEDLQHAVELVEQALGA